MDPERAAPSTRSSADRGAGLVSTSAAVMVFLVFLLFAVQILIGLYGRSVVTSAAYDGARAVAGARVDHGDPDAVERAKAAAVDRMRQQLGDVGSRATFDWSGTDGDTVVLRVQADNPRFSIPGMTGPLVTDHIDRTVRADRAGPVRNGRRIDWSDDAGQVGGIEVIPFGLLIFIVGTLLVAQAWAVIDVKLAVDAAAREGARTFVEAPDETAALLRADAAAREAITGHGRDPAQLVVDPPDYGGGTFARCTPVILAVHYPVPAVTLPWLGEHGDGFVVSATHAEIIDPYRSGLAATGGC